MGLLVPNMGAPLSDTTGRIVRPWNQFFQQFSNPPAPANIIGSVTDYTFIATALGSLFILGTPTTITLTRGSGGSNTVSVDVTGQKIIPVNIKDQVIIVGSANLKFFPSF